MNRSSLLIGLVSSLCSAVLPTARAGDDGSEFRAMLTVQAANPLQASLSFSPTIDMREVTVEVPNNAGGSRMQCTYPTIRAGSTYTCTVLGNADDQTTGLVIALAGSIGSSLPPLLSRKVFTVANPTYNANKTRATERAALEAKGRLQQSDPTSRR